METRLNKVKAFEPVPFSADHIVLRSCQPAIIYLCQLP